MPLISTQEQNGSCMPEDEEDLFDLLEDAQESHGLAGAPPGKPTSDCPGLDGHAVAQRESFALQRPWTMQRLWRASLLILKLRRSCQGSLCDASMQRSWTLWTLGNAAIYHGMVCSIVCSCEDAFKFGANVSARVTNTNESTCWPDSLEGTDFIIHWEVNIHAGTAPETECLDEEVSSMLLATVIPKQSGIAHAHLNLWCIQRKTAHSTAPCCRLKPHSVQS